MSTTTVILKRFFYDNNLYVLDSPIVTSEFEYAASKLKIFDLNDSLLEVMGFTPFDSGIVTINHLLRDFTIVYHPLVPSWYAYIPIKIWKDNKSWKIHGHRIRQLDRTYLMSIEVESIFGQGVYYWHEPEV